MANKKKGGNKMIKEIIQLLKTIITSLEEIKKGKQQSLPRLIYAKEIAENYKVNKNRATEFCKKYGVNFGGWCITKEKLKQVLNNNKEV